MRHEWTFMTLDGFGDGDTDFAARLAAADQSVRDEFDANIMFPMINGMAEGVVLVVAGHADRIDNGAEDHAARLRREGDASYARAVSAEDEILVKIGTDWLDPPPASWDELPEIAVLRQGRGATALAVEPADEADRQRNRRVALQVCRFFPDE